ncbi:MAG: hypothetical protein KA731_03250 [Candidatus Moranbacteria bacterium]|nr:hypothetical protein [Candidatus Moranbacteria bacterium]
MHSYLYKLLFLIVYGLSLPLAVVLLGASSRSSLLAIGSLAVVLGSFLIFVWLTAAETRRLDVSCWPEARRSFLVLLTFIVVSAGFSAGFGSLLHQKSEGMLAGAVLIFTFTPGFFGAIELSPLKFGNQDTFGYLVPGGCGALVASLFGLSAFREGWDLRETLEHLVLLLCWSAVCWAVFEIRLRRPAPKQAAYPSTGKAMSLSFMDETR